MERRKSASKGGGKPGKRNPTDQAKTALGAVPEKRGLKTLPGDKKTAAAGVGQRDMRVNVKTAKKRKLSSTLWLDRQLNDPYVARAKAEGYRSRAAYKLKEINEKFHLIRKGSRVVDLGCAPGGWLQAAVEAGATKVVGVDYLELPNVPGAQHLQLDFLEEGAAEKLKALLGGEADVVLSDMAAPTTGHKNTDHIRIIALAEAALDFAIDVLAPGGAFVCKVFQGGAEGELLARLKDNFFAVKHAKPKSSRADSAEIYVVATGFRKAKP
ncbi:MAG TPA: RlmE family RNA methyltransferase [Parvularculaceae bacterium]|nr:RlmE family RNA methyltransferase [Parvularculaceae bacterium]